MRALYQRTGELYTEESSEATPVSERLQHHFGGTAKIPE
jgi:hypothetical protein